jgi:hypothetical protein
MTVPGNGHKGIGSNKKKNGGNPPQDAGFHSISSKGLAIPVSIENPGKAAEPEWSPVAKYCIL